MKSLFAIVFLLLYGVALVRPLVPVVEYYFKLEEYKARCINQSKPELSCHGQCQLRQEIKAIENSTTDESAPVQQRASLDDFPTAVITRSSDKQVLPFVPSTAPALGKSAFFYQLSFVCEIFHPPGRGC